MQCLWLLLLLSALAFAPSVLCAKKKEKLQVESGREVKILTVGNPLTLYCSFFHKDGEPLKITWYEGETEAQEEEVESLDHREFTIYEETVETHVNNQTQKTTAKFRIDEAQAEDIGFYTCRVKGSPERKKEFLVTSITYTNMPKSTEVDEGTDLSLTCQASGDDNLSPVVHWLKEDVPLEQAVNASRLVIYANADNLLDGSFNITNVDQEDRGHYTCVITYDPKLTFRTTTNVRVKDPLRALWPFLGIVVQAIALAVTIFMCEKMRTKEGDDDSDSDSNIASAAVASTSRT